MSEVRHGGGDARVRTLLPRPPTAGLCSTLVQAMTIPAPGPDRAGGPSHAAPVPPASRRLARSAGVIGIATMTSRVLGLVRDQVMAYLFGAGNAVDAYNVAFRVPNLVRDLFAEGAMSAAFVPTFTRYLARDGRTAGWRLGNNVINALLVATFLIVCAGLVFTQPLVTMFAEDYASVPGKLDLTILLKTVAHTLRPTGIAREGHATMPEFMGPAGEGA